jgi:hypothetical protein
MTYSNGIWWNFRMIKSTWWNDMTKEMKKEYLGLKQEKPKAIPKKSKSEDEE